MSDDESQKTEQIGDESATTTTDEESPGAPVEAEQDAVTDAAPAPAEEKGPQPLFTPGMQWYVLRVASNREDQVCKSLERKVRVEGLDDRINRILVPTQREKKMRGKVAKVIDKKLYPGYVFVEMAVEDDGSIPEDIWFMIKETMSVGDFIGSDGKPVPMKPHDVEKMLAVIEKSAEQPTLSGMAGMKKGDAIKVKEGPFENFEGEIDEVYPDKGQVRVIVSIFGRATPIELEYWQVELTTEEE